MRSKNLVSVIALMTALTVSGVAEAKGGMSSGGGGGRSSGSFSSSSSSSASKGGFSSSSSSPSYRPSSPSPSPSASMAPPAPRPSAPVAQSAPSPQRQVTSTTTTTTQRSYTQPRSVYSAHVYGSPYYYGGWGMGYGYNNGLMTGIIIGNMMHPNNTVVYNGGGYGGNAVLYPNGAVVNPQGYQVGTYQNGQFIPMQNGPMVAQQAPADAFADQAQQSPSPQPVSQSSHWSFGEVFSVVFLLLLIGLMGWFLFGRRN